MLFTYLFDQYYFRFGYYIFGNNFSKSLVRSEQETCLCKFPITPRYLEIILPHIYFLFLDIFTRLLLLNLHQLY